MRSISAHKRENTMEPIRWNVSIQPKPIFHKIEFAGDVDTADGPMKLVRITSVAELANPGVDVACLIRNSVDPWAPEIWFWGDKFWCKAVDSLNVDYYRLKAFAIYEIEIENRDELLALLA